MSIIYFEGPAGSGKTTSLIRKLKDLLLKQPLLDEQKVLGLTYMHGARRRLSEKLNALTSLSKHYECTTIDLFAWRLVQRWKMLNNTLFIISEEVGDYDYVCLQAAKLLEHPEVRSWVASSYPIIIIDESQDCKMGRLDIIKQLSKSTIILCAADDFQDLNGEENKVSPAVEWLRQFSECEYLEGNFRTTEDELLKAALSLRNSSDIESKTKFKIMTAKSHHVAASFIGSTLSYKGTNDVVVLSPTRPTSSSFVENSVKKIVSQQIKPSYMKYPIGPFKVKWELDADELAQEILLSIGVTKTDISINIRDLKFNTNVKGSKELMNWLYNWRKANDSMTIDYIELSTQTKIITQRMRAYSNESRTGIKAMKIHQAKNQEFEGVIVLWPFKVVGNMNSQRRLLYNAVTRAKKWCVIIVQESNDNSLRINKEPFKYL